MSHERSTHRTAVFGVVALALLLGGCDAFERYRVLSTVFDGVPPPPTPSLAVDGGTAPSGPVLTLERGRFGEHGPYAAKLCDSCHASASSNTFVAPRDQLCIRCHDIQQGKKYVHGPLASGGCLACHDPHSSKYRYLLVSASDTFCLRCHSAADVARSPAHANTEVPCTSCHDPHMSDRKHLLR